MRWKNRVEVTAGFCILWAFLLLTLPVRVLLAAAAAACFHELCHLLAVRGLGGQLLGVTMGAGGMVMDILPMKPGRELVCALAGPAGSLLLALLGRWFPLLALCAFVQGCFNLLPLYPLDGGRAVSCFLRILCPNCWERVQNAVEWCALGILLVLAVHSRMGIGPVLVWGMLAMRKIPCKEARLGVQ